MVVLLFSAFAEGFRRLLFFKPSPWGEGGAAKP